MFQQIKVFNQNILLNFLFLYPRKIFIILINEEIRLKVRCRERSC